MRFQFRLKSVLMLRQRERDVQQLAVAEARSLLNDEIADRDRLRMERNAAMDALRIINDGRNWQADLVIHSQRHVDQLATKLCLAESAIIKRQSDLATCLDQLVSANQSVRLLEKLAERQLIAHQDALAKLAARTEENLEI